MTASFDPDTDQPQGLVTTTGDGDYLFTGLGPDVYFVDVINSTIPDGLVITTNNDPYGPITLGLGQNFLDADFGYYSPSEPKSRKFQTSPNPARVGKSIFTTASPIPVGDGHDAAAELLRQQRDQVTKAQRRRPISLPVTAP